MARNEKGQFKKGNTPHNKGARMEDYISGASIAKIRRTQFKKGILSAYRIAERHCKRFGASQEGDCRGL